MPFFSSSARGRTKLAEMPKYEKFESSDEDEPTAKGIDAREAKAAPTSESGDQYVINPLTKEDGGAAENADKKETQAPTVCVVKGREKKMTKKEK